MQMLLYYKCLYIISTYIHMVNYNYYETLIQILILYLIVVFVLQKHNNTYAVTSHNRIVHMTAKWQ